MVFKMVFNQVLENVQVNNIVLAAAGDGVISGLGVTEKGTPDMSVDVAAGSCMVGGTKYTESSIVNLAISAADATHARKDLVIYDIATTNPLVITGTPATPPIPPDITTGDVLLAIVDVAANETTITNSEITDCIVEIPKLDELATPSDTTNLNASAAVHGLLKKLSNSSAEFLNGQGNWATPAGSGDMSKSVYDANDDGVVNSADAAPWAGITDKPSTYPPTGHALGSSTHWADSLANLNSKINDANVDDDGDSRPPLAHSAALVTSGILAVARGGTGVSSSSSVANVNATKVDGCDAGTYYTNVLKIESSTQGAIIYYNSSGGVSQLNPSTDGYQLTTHGSPSNPSWAAASDLIFSDTHCPKCGKAFEDGDDLILHVIGHNEVGDILTVPMHLSCANAPKKRVMVKRKVMEDQHILDEETGELKVQRVQKTAEKTVTRHKLKEGYILDGVTGKAHKIDEDGTPGPIEHKLTDALETVEETIDEVIYEDVEYTL